MYERILIVGRVGRDPELRVTPHGVPVASFSVAVNHRTTDAAGQAAERTKWFRVTAWRKLAETCAQCVKKGQRILVEWEVQASAWVDPKDNSSHTARDLAAGGVRLLGDHAEPDAGAAADLPAGGEDGASG